ncbi:hypothetical protein OPT61_g6072 [Boeremia exigua]|uniref:Uncharacterized protein n=1 Tax=Boeremia exigua TaxID=749465 RepID=A0ACC2I7Z5_9PLEO|nr:hypothetical protein OPT61_g6072 [Boeremia exigua]
MRVNRQVHDACNDPILFKDVARHAFSRAPGAVDGLMNLYKPPERKPLKPEQLGWPEGEPFLNRISFEDQIRTAHAVERLVQLSTLTPTAWPTSSTSNMADWVPHLLALHHPACWYLEPDMFLLPHGQLSQSNTSLTSSLLVNRWLSRTNDQARDRVAFAKLQAVHFTNFGFMLNYTTLQRLCFTEKTKDVIELFVRHFVPDWSTDDSRLSTVVGMQEMTNVVTQRLSERIPGYATFNRDFSLTQASAALILLLVAIASENGNRILPTPARIPFASFMDLPSVYHRSAELFSTCHYRCMSTPAFLGGQWNGYYSDHRWFQNHTINIDAPMQAIQMIVQEPTEEARTRLRISAVIERETRGYDPHGDFRLLGRVREDGLVSIAKQYLGLGISWNWTGRITPFGIVGVWGDNSFGGYFWIFKNEWMA